MDLGAAKAALIVLRQTQGQIIGSGPASPRTLGLSCRYRGVLLQYARYFSPNAERR